ncbi:MAG: PEP-CTERM sorting domain-containing protein [Verrucomicrobiota bacterium]
MTILSSIFLSLWLSQAHGMIVQYSFETPGLVATPNATLLDPLLTAGAFNVGGGGNDLGAGLTAVAGPPSAPFGYGGSGWSIIGPPAATAPHYSFTVSTVGAASMTLSNLTFDLGYNLFTPGQPTQYQVLWDITGPGTFTALPGFGPQALPPSGFGGSWNNFVSAPLNVTNFTGTLEFRVMPFQGTGVPFDRIDIDDVTLNGFTTIPEPSSAALLALSITLIGTIRLRQRRS